MQDFILSCVLNALVGAAVGAGTNELAIRYLFWKVIPSKKEQIAEAIQRVISGELMSPEKIREKLLSEQVKLAVKSGASEFLDGYFQRELPSMYELTNRREDFLRDLEDKLAGTAAAMLHEYFSDERFYEENVKNFLRGQLPGVFNKTPLELWPEAGGAIEKVSMRLVEMAGQPSVQDKIANWLTEVIRNELTNSGKTWRELLTPNMVTDLKQEIQRLAPKFVDKLCDFLRRADVQEKIRKVITENVHEKINAKLPNFIHQVSQGKAGKYISNFLKIDREIESFCRQFPDQLKREFDQEDHDSEIYALADRLADDILDSSPGDLLRNTDDERIRELVQGVMQKFLTPETVSELGRQLFVWIKPWLDIPLRKSLGHFKVRLTPDYAAEFFTAQIRRIISSEDFKLKLLENLRQLLEKLRNQPIGRLDRFIQPNARNEIAALTGDILIDAASARFEDFAEHTGIWDIITDTIRGYDNRELERLVRKIANRELRWITVMGGIIGLFIGLIQGIMNYFIYR